MNTSDTLTLQVLNSQYLASGKYGSALFTTSGGSIGSSDKNEWSVQDQAGSVESIHAQIDVIDSYYCIKAHAPNLLLNNIDLFIKGKPVRLQHGDLINLCDLTVRVQLNKNGIMKADPLAMRPEEIISNHQDPLNEILSKEIATSSEFYSQEFNHDPEIISPIPLDPMKVLDSEHMAITAQQTPMSTTTFQSPSNSVLEQSVTLNPQEGYFFNDEDRLMNVAINPLYQGLKSTLPLENSQEAYELLEEIGHSLKTVIEGLKDLHSNNQYLADKHLRPTEDNPLRLNQSYQETINLLYSTEKCPVHLSAPSAIAESIAHIKLHHEANQLATSEALSALLDAFAPQALMSRFARYRRQSDKSQIDSTWAWNMYSSYYNELLSKRQKGFDKLFWEVYSHAYDRNMRQLQNNQDKKDYL